VRLARERDDIVASLVAVVNVTAILAAAAAIISDPVVAAMAPVSTAPSKSAGDSTLDAAAGTASTCTRRRSAGTDAARPSARSARAAVPGLPSRGESRTPDRTSRPCPARCSLRWLLQWWPRPENRHCQLSYILDVLDDRITTKLCPYPTTQQA
jgi:hypothetical protein